MPACKNDAKRHFKGDEPSPKGRGYCAHADPVGKRRIGGDRKMWIVKSYKNKTGKSVKRWVHSAKKVVAKKKVAPKKKVAAKKPATRKRKLGQFQGGGLSLPSVAEVKERAKQIMAWTARTARQHTVGLPKMPDQVKTQYTKFSHRLARYAAYLQQPNAVNKEQVAGEVNGLVVILDLLRTQYKGYDWSWLETTE